MFSILIPSRWGICFFLISFPPLPISTNISLSVSLLFHFPFATNTMDGCPTPAPPPFCTPVSLTSMLLYLFIYASLSCFPRSFPHLTWPNPHPLSIFPIIIFFIPSVFFFLPLSLFPLFMLCFYSFSNCIHHTFPIDYFFFIVCLHVRVFISDVNVYVLLLLRFFSLSFYRWTLFPCIMAFGNTQNRNWYTRLFFFLF